MKSIESRLRELEAAMANRKIARISKLQRDQGVKQACLAFRSGNRGEMLEAALEACRVDRRTTASQEQREAAVKAAFQCFADEAARDSRQSLS